MLEVIAHGAEKRTKRRLERVQLSSWKDGVWCENLSLKSIRKTKLEKPYLTSPPSLKWTANDRVAAIALVTDIFIRRVFDLGYTLERVHMLELLTLINRPRMRTPLCFNLPTWAQGFCSRGRRKARLTRRLDLC